MAMTYIYYTGDGTTNEFLVPFDYIKKDYVKFYIDEKEVDSGEVTWDSDTQVSFAVPPSRGSKILIKRETEIEEPLVDFRDGSTLTEDELDMETAQLLHLIQEGTDNSTGATKILTQTLPWLVDSIDDINADSEDGFYHIGSYPNPETARYDASGYPVTATGSTAARTLQERFGDFVSVKDFGAKGDGETDDTVAFQAAAASGKRIFVPQGTYSLSEHVSGNFFSFGNVVFNEKKAGVVDYAIDFLHPEATSKCVNGEGSIAYVIPFATNYQYGWTVGVQGFAQQGDTFYVLRYGIGRIYKYQKSDYCSLQYVGTSSETNLLGHQSIDVDLNGNLIVPCADYKSISRTTWIEEPDNLSLSPIQIIPNGYNGSSSPTAVLSKDKSKLVCTGIDENSKRVILIYDYNSLRNGIDESANYDLKIELQNWEETGAVQGLAFDGTYIYIIAGSAGINQNNVHFYVYDLYGRKISEDLSYKIGLSFASNIYNEADEGAFIREPEALVWVQTSRGVELCTLMVIGHAGHRFALLFSYADSQMTAKSITFINDKLPAYGGNDVGAYTLMYDKDRDAIAVCRRGRSSQSLAKDLFLRVNNYVSFTTNSGNLNFSVPSGSTYTFASHTADYSVNTVFARLDATYGFRAAGNFWPSTASSYDCGTQTYPWRAVHGNNIYSSDGTIKTSDARAKTAVRDVNEALMRAWGKVSFYVYQMIEAVQKKGAEQARLHVGVIAQEVQTAFASEGLDADRYGLFCYDEWNAEEAAVDSEGTIVKEAHPAGSRYGIRYSEALALECAYQRWLGEQRDRKIAELESKLKELTDSNEQ